MAVCINWSRLGDLDLPGFGHWGEDRQGYKAQVVFFCVFFERHLLQMDFFEHDFLNFFF